MIEIKGFGNPVEVDLAKNLKVTFKAYEAEVNVTDEQIVFSGISDTSSAKAETDISQITQGLNTPAILEIEVETSGHWAYFSISRIGGVDDKYDDEVKKLSKCLQEINNYVKTIQKHNVYVSLNDLNKLISETWWAKVGGTRYYNLNLGNSVTVGGGKEKKYKAYLIIGRKTNKLLLEAFASNVFKETIKVSRFAKIYPVEITFETHLAKKPYICNRKSDTEIVITTENPHPEMYYIIYTAGADILKRSFLTYPVYRMRHNYTIVKGRQLPITYKVHYTHWRRERYEKTVALCPGKPYTIRVGTRYSNGKLEPIYIKISPKYLFDYMLEFYSKVVIKPLQTPPLKIPKEIPKTPAPELMTPAIIASMSVPVLIAYTLSGGEHHI